MQTLQANLRMILSQYRDALLFAIFACLLNLDKVVLGPYSLIPHGDMLGWDIAIKLAYGHNMRTSGMHYWFPNILGGIDGSVAGQACDLMFLPYFILPAWLATFIVSSTILFVASFSMYVLLRWYLKYDSVPAVIGAVVCGSFTVTTPFFGLGIASMPLLILIVRYVVDRMRFISGMTLVVLSGVMISLSSGVFWTLPFVVPLVLVWVLAVDPRRRGKIAATFLVLGFAIVVARLPMLISMIENAEQSHRAGFDLMLRLGGAVNAYYSALYWWTLDYRLLAWVPVGAILFYKKHKDRTVLITVGIALGVLIVCPMWDAVRAAFKEQLGSLVGMNWYFHRGLPFFLGVACAGLVQGLARNHMDVVIKGLGGVWGRWSGAQIATIALIIITFYRLVGSKGEELREWLDKGSAYADLGVSLLKTLPSPKVDPYRVVTVQRQGDSEAANLPIAYGLETADGYTSMYPRRYNRFWRKVIDPTLVSDERLRREYDGWGNRAIIQIPRDIERVGDLAKYVQLDLLSLSNVRYVISRAPINDKRLHLESAPEIWASDRSIVGRVWKLLRKNFEGRDVYVYRNNEAFPRYRLVGEVKVFADSDVLLDEIARSDVSILERIAFVEGVDAGLFADVSPGRHEIWQKQYEPDRFELLMNSEKRGILVIASNWHSGWRCTADGIAMDVYRVNYAFWGLVVEPGRHEIECEYQPAVKRIVRGTEVPRMVFGG